MKLDSFHEIVEFAHQREEEAVEFYLQCSEIIERPAIKKELFAFAEEEKKHVRMLENLHMDDITEQQIDIVYNLKIADYLVDEVFTPDMKYQDILVLAMKRETASYNLYNQFATNSSDAKITKLFQVLAQEELKHKNYFEKEYDDHVLREN